MSVAAKAAQRGYAMVNVSELQPNPLNPRSRYDEAALQELTDSIRVFGVLEPLLVTPIDDGLIVVAGERRRRAALAAGVQRVPVVIEERSATEQLEVQLTENLLREDLGPVDEARAIQRLLAECGMTQEQLGARLGKSQPWISNRIRLLRLPEMVLADLQNGKLSAGHAGELLKYEATPAIVEAAAKRIVKEKIPVADVEQQAVRKILNADNHRGLNEYTAKFDLKDCKGCEHRHQPGYEPVCLNPTCWEQKQAAAVAEKEAALRAKLGVEGTIPTVVELEHAGKRVKSLGGREDLTCKGCEHRVIAKPYYGDACAHCDNPGCLQAKREARFAEDERQAQAALRASLDQMAAAGERAERGLEVEHLAFLLCADLLSHDGGGYVSGNAHRVPRKAEFVKSFLGLKWPDVEPYQLNQPGQAAQLRTFTESLCCLPATALRSALIQWTLIAHHRALGDLPELVGIHEAANKNDADTNDDNAGDGDEDGCPNTECSYWDEGDCVAPEGYACPVDKGEPADNGPGDEEPVRRCRVCGCTDDHACPGGCYWVEEDLCSRCAEKLAAEQGK